MQIGEILKDLRNEKDLKQAELAEALGLTQDKISRLENGGMSYSCDELIAISKYFNVSTDYLLGLTENKTAVDTDEGQLLRAICEYTGLNQNSVLQLNKSEKNRKAIPLFDEMLQYFDLSKMFNLMCSNEIFIKLFCSNFLNYFDDKKIDEIKKRLWLDGEIVLGVDVSTLFLLNMQQNIINLKNGTWQNSDKALNELTKTPKTDIVEINKVFNRNKSQISEIIGDIGDGNVSPEDFINYLNEKDGGPNGDD